MDVVQVLAEHRQSYREQARTFAIAGKHATSKKEKKRYEQAEHGAEMMLASTASIILALELSDEVARYLRKEEA